MKLPWIDQEKSGFETDVPMDFQNIPEHELYLVITKNLDLHLTEWL